MRKMKTTFFFAVVSTLSLLPIVDADNNWQSRGMCCNRSSKNEVAIVDPDGWVVVKPGECVGQEHRGYGPAKPKPIFIGPGIPPAIMEMRDTFQTDCEGMTCNGVFYKAAGRLNRYCEDGGETSSWWEWKSDITPWETGDDIEQEDGPKDVWPHETSPLGEDLPFVAPPPGYIYDDDEDDIGPPNRYLRSG